MTKRTFLTAKNPSHLRAFLDDNIFRNASVMAKAFSVSSSTMSSWLSEATPTPRWTLLAAEGLVRRRRAEKDDLFFLSLPRNKPEAIKVMRQLATSFGGKMSATMRLSEEE